MDYVVNYLNFNESKGISDSCEYVLYDIWKEIQQNITSQKSDSFKLDINKDDFKVKDLVINYKFSPSPENNCYGTIYLKNSSIENNYLINSHIDLDIKVNYLDDEFIYYIKSVLFHEILHLFQHYNIRVNDKFRPESFSIGSIIPQLRNSIKTEYVNYILDILYYSLSHELSAQLHQYYMYMIDGKEYKRIKEIKKLLNNFKIKELDKCEEMELDYIKKHILNSIKFFTTNNNYKKDISKSIWTKNNKEFIMELYNIIGYKMKWIDKKIKLIDSKRDIDYSETFTYYGELKDYKYFKFSFFVNENLNDCPLIEFI